MSDPRPTVSVVVPVYNSADMLAELVTQLEAVLPQVASASEIILVNDGSRDDSWAKIQALASTRPHVRGLDLMRNYGQHNALLAGIRAAAYDLIVTMDDDLQNPPDQIPVLLTGLTPSIDVVFGVPVAQQHGLWRDLASWTTKLVLQQAMGTEIARRISAFRVFRTGLRQAFGGYMGPDVSIDVLLTWATTRFAAVTVEHHPRWHGQSGYTLGKLIQHAMNMMTGFSTLPLRMASMTGFTFTAFGLLVLLYVIGRFLLFGVVVPGFAFLASCIAIFAGAQLFALGIMGEYLARAHFRIMDKPTYTIRRDTGAAGDAV